MGDAEQGGGSATLDAAPVDGAEGAPRAPRASIVPTPTAVSVPPAPLAPSDGAAHLASDLTLASVPTKAAEVSANGVDFEEIEVLDELDVIADLDDEDVLPVPELVPSPPGAGWRAGPPPLPRAQAAVNSDLPILSVIERDVPTQIVRAEKVLARAREVKRQEQEAGRTLLFTPDADAIARRAAAVRAARADRLKKIGLGLLLLAFAIVFGSVLALHRDRAGQWLASLGGGGYDEPIEAAPADDLTEPIGEVMPIEEKPVEAAKPVEAKPVETAKVVEEKPVEATKPLEEKLVEGAKPAEEEPVEAARPVEEKLVEAAKPDEAPKPPSEPKKVKAEKRGAERSSVVRAAKMVTMPEPKLEKSAGRPLANGTGAQKDSAPPGNVDARQAGDAGWLAIDAEPGVSIEIYDVKVGKTPLPKLELDPGSYTVWASKSGYEVFTQDVKILPGKVTPLAVKLVAIPKIGPDIK